MSFSFGKKKFFRRTASNSHSVASISEPKIQFVNLYVNCQLWLSFIKIVVGIFVYWKTLEMYYMLHMHQDVYWLLHLCQIDIVMVWCWGGINSIKIVIELNIGFWTVPISYININCSVAFWEIKSCETKFSIGNISKLSSSHGLIQLSFHYISSYIPTYWKVNMKL